MAAPTPITAARNPNVAIRETGPDMAYVLEAGASALARLIHTEVVTAHPRRSAPNKGPSESPKKKRPRQTASQSSVHCFIRHPQQSNTVSVFGAHQRPIQV